MLVFHSQTRKMGWFYAFHCCLELTLRCHCLVSLCLLSRCGYSSLHSNKLLQLQWQPYPIVSSQKWPSSPNKHWRGHRRMVDSRILNVNGTFSTSTNTMTTRRLDGTWRDMKRCLSKHTTADRVGARKVQPCKSKAGFCTAKPTNSAWGTILQLRRTILMILEWTTTRSKQNDTNPHAPTSIDWNCWIERDSGDGIYCGFMIVPVAASTVVAPVVVTFNTCLSLAHLFNGQILMPSQI
jgi:hypothetical protein